jgi:hypothetical protein
VGVLESPPGPENVHGLLSHLIVKIPPKFILNRREDPYVAVALSRPERMTYPIDMYSYFDLNDPDLQKNLTFSYYNTLRIRLK